MSSDEHSRTSSDHEEVANAFDRSTDPLAEFEPKFRSMDASPLEMYIRDRVETRDCSDSTASRHQRVATQWQEYMHQQGRHPACPNTPLVKGFIRWRREEHGNGPKTIRKKLGVLKQIYRYWQESPSFPHSDDFNPFEAVRARRISARKITNNCPESQSKNFERLSTASITFAIY
jgi:integrase/recombinase XerD